MERIMKTARVTPELGKLSMAAVVGAIEDYVFQLKSVQFLRDTKEQDAADKLEEKIVWDLGRNIAAIVDKGLAPGARGKSK